MICRLSDEQKSTYERLLNKKLNELTVLGNSLVYREKEVLN